MDDLNIVLQAKLDEVNSQRTIDRQISQIEKKLQTLNLNVKIDDKILTSIQKFTDSLGQLSNLYKQQSELIQQNIELVNALNNSLSKFQEINVSNAKAIEAVNNALKKQKELSKENIQDIEMEGILLQKRIKKINDEFNSVSAKYDTGLYSTVSATVNKHETRFETETFNLDKVDAYIQKLKEERDVVTNIRNSLQNINPTLSQTAEKLLTGANNYTYLIDKLTKYRESFEKFTVAEKQELEERLNTLANNKKALDSYIQTLTEAHRLQNSINKIDLTKITAKDPIQYTKITEQYDQINKKIQEYLNLEKTLTPQVKQYIQQRIDGLKNEYEQLLKNQELAQKIRAFQQQQNINITRLQTRYSGLVDEEALRQYREELNDLSVNTPDVINKMQQMQLRLKEIEANAQNSAKALDLSNRSAISFSQALQTALDKIMIWAIGTTAFYQTLHFFTNAVNYVNELDNSLNQIRIVTGQSQEQIQNLSKEFQNLAVNMHVTNKDIVDAAVEFYRQGLNQSQVMDRMKTTIEYAKVSGLEFNEAAQILTATVNSMNIPIEKAADTFAYLGDATATGADEIGKAFQKVGGTAAALGVDFDKVASWIAVISAKTRESSESIGDSLRTLMARYQQIKEKGYVEEDGTKLNQVTQALKRATIDAIDAQTKQLRNFGNVMDELGTKWDTLDTKTKGLVATAMAGTYQQSRFLNLMENYSESVKLYEGALASAGTLQEKYNIWLESTDAHLANLDNMIKKLYTTLFDSEGIKFAIDSLTGFLNVVNLVAEKLGGLPVTVTTAYTALLLFSKTFRSFIMDLVGGQILETLAELGMQFKALAWATEIYTSATKSAAIATTLFKAAITGGIVFVISMVIEYLVNLANKHREAAAEAQQHAQTIKSAFAAFTQASNDFNNSLDPTKLEAERAAFENLAQALDVATAKKNIKELQDKIEQLQNNINKYEKMGLGSDDNIARWRIQIKQYSEELQKNQKIVDDYNRAHKILIEDEKKAAQQANEHAKALGYESAAAQQAAEENQRLYQELEDKFNQQTKSVQELYKIQNELNSQGKLSADTLQMLITNHQELLPYLNDEVALRKKLQEEIAKQTAAQKNAYQTMLENSETYFKAILDGNKTLYEDLQKLRKADGENFRTIAELKAKINAELIADLDKQWRKHYQSEAEALEALIVAKEREIAQYSRLYGDNDYVQQLRSEVNILRQQLGVLNELTNIEIPSLNNIDFSKINIDSSKSSGSSSSKSKPPYPYADIIQKAADTYGVDPNLIAGVINQETGGSWNPRAYNRTSHASGLMQFLPSTFKWLGFDTSKIFDPATNIMAGAKYLRYLLDEFHGNVQQALAAYNWGEGNVRKSPNKYPPLVEAYVNNVIRYTNEYAKKARSSGYQATGDETYIPKPYISTQPDVESRINTVLALSNEIDNTITMLQNKISEAESRGDIEDKIKYEEQLNTKLKERLNIYHQQADALRTLLSQEQANFNKEFQALLGKTVDKVTEADISRAKNILENNAIYFENLAGKTSDTLLKNSYQRQAEAIRERIQRLETNYNNIKTIEKDIVDLQNKWWQGAKDVVDVVKQIELDKLERQFKNIDEVIKIFSDNITAIDNKMKLLDQNDLIGQYNLLQEKIKTQIALNREYQMQLDALSSLPLPTTTEATQRLKEEQDKLNQSIQEGNINLKDYQNTLNDLKTRIVDTVGGLQSEIAEALRNKYQQEKEDALADLETIEKVTIPAKEAEIERLRAELEALQDDTQERQDKLNALKQELTAWQRDDSVFAQGKIKELQKQIADEEKQLKIKAKEQEIKTKEDELKQLQDTTNQAKKIIEDQHDDLLDDANIYAEANKMIVAKNQEEIVNLLMQYGSKYRNAGELLGSALKEGLTTEIQNALNIVGQLLNNGTIDFSKLLPSNSADQNVALDAIKQDQLLWYAIVRGRSRNALSLEEQTIIDYLNSEASSLRQQYNIPNTNLLGDVSTIISNVSPMFTQVVQRIVNDMRAGKMNLSDAIQTLKNLSASAVNIPNNTSNSTSNLSSPVNNSSSSTNKQSSSTVNQSNSAITSKEQALQEISKLSKQWNDIVKGRPRSALSPTELQQIDSLHAQAEALRKQFNIPSMATGGLVTAPTLAYIAEQNKPEAVLPLDKIGDVMQRIIPFSVPNLNNNLKSITSQVFNAPLIHNEIKQYVASQFDMTNGLDNIGRIMRRELQTLGYRTNLLK